MPVTVRLTKDDPAAFGKLEPGTVLEIKVPDRVKGEQEQKIRARKMLDRDHPGENPMEWEAEIVYRRSPGEVFAETDPEHWPDGRPTFGKGR